MRGTASLLATPSQDWLRIIGRLPDAGRLAVAQTQADTALRQWLSAQTFPTAEEREEVARARTPIVSASAGVETLRMTFQAPLKLLSVVSGLVLLIAVANLANLLIAHSDRGQTAIRVALGASPQRLVRQAVSEGVALSLVLLTGAGLLGTSLRQLQQQSLGFEPADRVVVRLDLNRVLRR